MHGSLLLIMAGVMLAAGCAGSATAPQATRSSARPARGAAAKSAGVATSATSATPRQRAAADARAILSSFVPPPGAVKLAKKPPLLGGGTMTMMSTTQVDAVGYWRVTGQPTALLAWEKAHISRSYSHQNVIIGPPSWDTVYWLPAIPGVLPLREMNVQAYAEGGGMTVIMADAMVSWQPSRPASEVIPASVRMVTIAASGPWQGNPRPVTISSASVVRRLTELVNSLPVTTVDNDIPCPMAAGLTLTFTAPGGQPVAVANGPAECGVVQLTLRGEGEPDLQPPGSYLATVLKIAGLHWQLP
jgi:hypothetical protein